MNNKAVCEYVEKMKPIESEYFAEKLVNTGYGQTCGGYLQGIRRKEAIEKRTSQREHFLSYYGSEKKKDKSPSYNYLRCPQLLLFIAEIAGVQKEKLEEAYNIITKYEDEHDLKGKEKDANYIYRECGFKDLKKVLQISMIVKIINESDYWCEVREKVSLL